MQKKNNILVSFKLRTTATFALIVLLVLISITLHIFNLTKEATEQKAAHNQQKNIINYSKTLNSYLKQNIDILNNITLFFKTYKIIPQVSRRKYFTENLRTIIDKNPQIYALWTVFKPYSIDTLDNQYSDNINNISGQFCINYYYQNDIVVKKEIDITDYETLDNISTKFQNNNNVILNIPTIDPYWKLSGTKYIAQIITPIIDNNKIIGIIGLDIKYETIKNIFEPNNSNYIIIDNNHKIIFSNNNNYINKELTEALPLISENYELIKQLSTENIHSNTSHITSPDKENIYSIFTIKIPKLSTNWKVIFYSKEINSSKIIQNNIFSIIILPIIIFIIAFIIIFLFSYYISIALKNIEKNISNLFITNYKITRKKHITKEFRTIQQSIIKNHRTITNYNIFISALVKLEQNDNIKIPKENILYDNLTKIKSQIFDNLKQKKQQEIKQKYETEKSNALAALNDIQREFNNDLAKLAYNTIKYLAHFTNALQGGFYTIHEDNAEYLTLIAYYSYNRKIYSKKKIKLGDGLVGTCALEQKPIYTKIPDNYLKITSGLGSKSPNFLALTPLIFHNDIMGIIELAFIGEINNQTKEFLSEAATVIASSISASRTNIRTLKLLEETRKVTSDMQDKEKTMNQQITQLEKLKEKNKITERDRTALLKTINKIIFFAEFDTNTSVLDINDNLSEKLQIQSTDAQMLTYYEIFNISENLNSHHEYWDNVNKGKTVQFELPINSAKSNLWFNCILSPVFDVADKIYKVIFFAIEITEIKKKEKLLTDSELQINEKTEQIAVQETEIQNFFIEYENMNKKLEDANEKEKLLINEKEKLQMSFEFIKKEFEKRSNYSKQYEDKLKKKINLLEEEIEFLKKNPNKSL